MQDLKERLLSRIVKTKFGCWEWQRTLRNGYGALKVDGKLQGAHRLSYRVFKGEIPNGLCVCHTCDNPKCINPKHLFVGTHSDNMRDGWQKDRIKPPIGQRFKQGYIPPNRTFTNKEIIKVKCTINKLYPSLTLKEISMLTLIPYQIIRDMRRRKNKTYST